MSRVFISYSWDSTQHRAWVRQLATDLKARGLDVWLDIWEIGLGDIIAHSMERGLSQADYVLLICTERFAAKANDRTGGVGYEQSIVSTAILTSQPLQGRFVCILRSGEPSAAIPLFMQSRLFLDMRKAEDYEHGLDQLTAHLSGPREDNAFASGVKPEQIRNAMASQIDLEAAGKPGAWILVAGTGLPEKFTPELKELSEYLGGRLAEEGFGLVTGAWQGVDETVARAFAARIAERRVALEDLLIQTVVNGEEPAFAAGQLVFIKKGRAEWDEPISRADAVVLLGGLGGAWTTGEISLGVRKPVFPVADTGGDAKRMYLSMLERWNSLGWMKADQKDFFKLARAGRSGVDAALGLLHSVRN